jgi:hypothetical protein
MASAAGNNLRAIAKRSRSTPRKIVEAATKQVSKTVTKGLNVDTGGDRVLSGTNRQGRAGKLRAVAKVTGDAVVTGSVKAGPGGRTVAIWSWLEYGTGEPGPTAAKYTWSRSAIPAMDVAQRGARRQLATVMEG